MIRKFIGFDEAAAMLESDSIGFRQAFELGLGSELPAYICARELPYLAYLSGAGVENTAGDIHDQTSAMVVIPGFGKLTYFDLWDPHKIGDQLGEIKSSELCQFKTGHPATFELKGYFRVAPHQLKDAARTEFAGMTDVAPDSWWADESPIPRTPNGPPAVQLVLTSTRDPGYLELPRLGDLQFKIADVEMLREARNALPTDSAPHKPLDERERASLLRIIRALDVMAKLPKRGAATPIEKQLQELGFDKPGEATIRKAIDDARALEPDKPQ